MTPKSTRITLALTLTAILAGTGLASAQTYRDPAYSNNRGMINDRGYVRYGVPQPAYPEMYYSPYGYDGTGNPSSGHGSVNPGSPNSGPETAG
jgi:hypothetical protein